MSWCGPATRRRRIAHGCGPRWTRSWTPTSSWRPCGTNRTRSWTSPVSTPIRQRAGHWAGIVATFLGTPVSTLAPGATGAGVLDLLVTAVESGGPLVLDDFTYANPWNPSQTLHYDIRGVPMGDGLSLTWRDVTERQSTVAEVAASEERYRLLAENSSDVVIRIRDGIVLWTSPSITAALGWTPQEAQGRPVAGFVHPEDAERVATVQAEVVAGRSGTSRFRLRAKDGGQAPLDGESRRPIRRRVRVAGRDRRIRPRGRRGGRSPAQTIGGPAMTS